MRDGFCRRGALGARGVDARAGRCSHQLLTLPKGSWMNAWFSSCLHSPSTMNLYWWYPGGRLHTTANTLPPLGAGSGAIGTVSSQLVNDPHKWTCARWRSDGSVVDEIWGFRAGSRSTIASGDAADATTRAGRATRGEWESRRGRVKFRRVSRSRTHLLAAVAPHEPGGEHHLFVHGLLRHGVRSPSELQRPRRDSVPLHV